MLQFKAIVGGFDAMRLFIFLASVSLSGSAFAETITRSDANLEASIFPLCRFNALSPEAVTGGQATVLPNGLSVNLGQIVDDQTAEPRQIALRVDFGSTCNFSHQLSLRSQNGGLTLQGPSPFQSSDFVMRRDFSASLAWSGATASFQTNGTPNTGVSVSINGASSGRLTLTLDAPAGGLPLVAGTFADILYVDISSGP